MKKLSIIAILLLGNHLSMPLMAETLDYIVAVVNDDVIVNSTLQDELHIVLKKWHEKKNRLPSQKDMEKQVLENLIMTTLQLQLAKRTGIQVEDSLLNEKIREIAEKTNQDLQNFRHEIEKEGYRYELVREKLRERMIIESLQMRQVVSRINITQREIDNFLSNQIQQGTTSEEYHLLHILIATPDAPSPEEIEAKKQQANNLLAKLKQGADFQAMALKTSNGSKATEGGDLGWFKAGEMPTLFHSIVNKMDIGEIKGSLRDSSGFHLIKLIDKRGKKSSIITQTKVRHILIKINDLSNDIDAKNRLKELKFRIEQGDDFFQLARANSEDSGTTAKGGSLDWVNPGDLVPEFEKVMNNLSKKQISEPFKSRYGWHIVQVLARRQHDNTEQASRTRAERQIRKRKINEELESWLRQLHDEAYIENRFGDSK
jgi:peptidyl-prolyl cis-trans isomerase SurA